MSRPPAPPGRSPAKLGSELPSAKSQPPKDVVPLASPPRKLGREFAIMFLVLLGTLAILFHGVFRPDTTLFSNDGPLGRLSSECHKLPDRFTGCWGDLNGIGFNGGMATPGISLGLQYLLKPVWFSKLYALVSLVILGLGAWCFFTQLRFTRAACLLGGLAAALNSCFFAVACWGVAAQPIAAGMTFLAMAALTDTTSPLRWWRAALGGLAVGMGVIEGADVGAILSLYVVAFLIYQAWFEEGPAKKRIMLGVARVALVAVCAGCIAAQTVVSLVGTSIVGVVGTQQDAQTKESRWDFATQWSLPVEETLGLAVPGLFGYRMDTGNGGAYWGKIGMDPAVERFLASGRQGTPPRGFMRYSGGGFYAGVLVVVLGFWAIVQSLRKKDSVFSLAQRRWLWFWLAVAFFSVLVAYGRFAPFYQVLYALPYFSTIRNPVKFMYLVSLALIVIFGYGADGLYRRYMDSAAPKAAPKAAGSKLVRTPASSFEKTWMQGCWIFLGASLVAWLVYASEYDALVAYLHSVQFRDIAVSIASFSIRQPGWFVLFFALATVLLGRVFAGAFAGPKAKWCGILLGLLLLADLGRANLPWVLYWNYKEKYATNPIIEQLREKPYEHRVTYLNRQTPPGLPSLDKVYRLEWLQQQFPYYNIQTLDIVEMPRKPRDLAAYSKALSPAPGAAGYLMLSRTWQLTNTRYVIGLADSAEAVKVAAGLTDSFLRVVNRFNLVPKPEADDSAASGKLTAVLDDNGPFALFEYTGALPRAKLFSHWQTMTNDQAVLGRLASPDFDPGQSVIVSDPLPAGVPAAATNQNSGTVEFASYASKDIVLKCEAPAPAVLLLNDHYDPDWKVLVDGRPDKLLHGNFIMRAVWLPAGAHTVEFRYETPHGLLYVTLSVMGAGLLLLMGVIIASPRLPKTS